MPPPRPEHWAPQSKKSWQIFKPEAAYFFADDNGDRSGAIVFDMKDTSEIPAVSEPWFLAFNAQASFRPIMNPQDLAKGAPSIGMPSTNAQSKPVTWTRLSLARLSRPAPGEEIRTASVKIAALAPITIL